MFFMYVFKGIYAPASHHRLRSLKHALLNVYLASFLGSVDTFTRSTDAQLFVSYYLLWGRVFKMCFHC